MTSHRQRTAVELITGCQRALYGYILSLVGSRDAADDILQNTNTVLCDKVDQFDGQVKFTTWACRIAYFEVLAYRKREGRDRLAFVDASLLDDLSQAALEEADAADERLTLLRQCMEQLPARSRKLIEQRYLPGTSVQDLASKLGRSAAGMRVSLHRIRKILLQCIDGKLATEGEANG